MKVFALLVIPAFFVLSGLAYADDTLAILNTEQGRLVLEFFPKDAPDHVSNFVTLAKDGVYTDTSFHQIIPGLIIQGVDTNTISGDMTAGDPLHMLDAEFNDIMHKRGVLSMFITDDSDNVGSQFFIVHQDANYLDGAYTVFGRLATHDSYDTLDSIAATTTSLLAEPQNPDTVRILSVEVTTRDEAISSGIPIIEQGPPARTGQAADMASGGMYTNEELDLMIRFPQGWVVQHANGTDRPDVVATSTHFSGIPTSIGVYVEDAGNHTFDTMMLSRINDMEEFAVGDDDSIIEKNQDLSVLGEYDALVSDVSFVRTSLGDTGDVIIKMRQVTVLNEPTGTAYTFLFSADIDDFEKYFVYFDETLHTFDTIKKPQTIDDVADKSQTVGDITMEDIDDAYTAGVIASAASYDWDSNTLVISFTGPIGPLVNLSHVSIVDSYCATVFTHEEYRGRDQDRMSIIIEPNELQRTTLASMSGPDVYIRQGAFYDVSGEILNSSEVSMMIAGSPPSGNHPCIITYGSNELLLEVYAHNHTQTLQAVHDGFGAWSELNPHLEFIWVERNPLIWIEWAEYQSEYVGLACIWCLGHEAFMDIILYGYNCEGERIHHSPNSVRNTVAHELGHILGLEHHVNQTHLMYGEDFLRDPFPTLGYTIPAQLPEGFVGQDELVSRYEALGKTLESMSDELDRLGGNLDQFASRHGDNRGGTVYFDTNAHFRQYSNMVDEYNDLVDEYNDLVDEYNALAYDLNCMHEANPPRH